MSLIVHKKSRISKKHLLFVGLPLIIISSVLSFYLWPQTEVAIDNRTTTVESAQKFPDVTSTPLDTTPESTPESVPDTTIQKLLDEYIASSPGTYMVSFREIGGAGRTADIQSDRLTVTASTYKMFVAYAALSLAEKSGVDLQTVVHQGSTISECIEIALLESENECIKAVGFYIGWQRITDIAHEAGFSSVYLNNFNADMSFNGNKLVNARDEASFLYDLQAGKLLSQANTTYLLNTMKRQIHRSGIPAGSSGNIVADKPGWLDGIYYHDAGIVYTDSGNYVLVVMTENIGNWSGVQTVAKLVQGEFNK